ncbi:MAG TPA: GC-type dockerin domain-anchored protein [Phycisphaerales bacterium]|nr:GC-type dockerin domain-anchored protein [Phycisphaerales bacterium]
MNRRLRLVTVAGRAAVFGALLLAAPALAADQIPGPLKGIVFGGSKRPIVPVTLNGLAFDSVRTFSDLPYLLWPSDAGAAIPPPTDPEAVQAWLARAAPDLGSAGFEPRFVEAFTWYDNTVWKYELVREGAVLHDARIELHWNHGRLAGIVNHLDGRIIAIDDARPARNDSVYYAVATDGGMRALLARADRKRLADRTVLEVVAPDGAVLEREHTPDPVALRGGDPEFTEYPVPNGSFPDQISVAPDGRVWLSDPGRDKLFYFEPTGEVFGSYDTTGASGPDGMIVGTADRVWTGMYYSGGLGMLRSDTGVFTEYPAPYSGSAMAIPVETTDGKVWVTDHQSNKISEFDPATNAWIKTINMPTANCWVVQGHEDPGRGHVYFTEYNANKLGRIPLGGNAVTDLLTPGGGPAFCVYTADKVYYSRWNESGIGMYDVIAGTFTEYNFPVNNEGGGPLWLRPNGDIVCGTLGRGYVMVFDVSAQSFTALEIPTAFPGLKDGMTVGADDTIWFTETGANKLGKLVFCPSTCVADFNGDGAVNTQDVLAFLNAWTSGQDSADMNGDGEINTLDVLAFLNLWTTGC